MKPMLFDDVSRAMDWGLEARFLETKMDSSVLICLCQAIIDQHEVNSDIKTLFDWALRSGAQMRLLEAHSGMLFQIASFPGALWTWERLLNHGYALDKVIAKVVGPGPVGRVSRVTTKLGLLCSAPYCLSHELPDLIALLISRGIDPNERDSDGYAPIGRLNEQLRLYESNNITIELFVSALVRGVEVLIANGADIDGILPVPEAFAAKAIQECVRAKQEQTELLQHIVIPPVMLVSEERHPHGRSL